MATPTPATTLSYLDLVFRRCGSRHNGQRVDAVFFGLHETLPSDAYCNSGAAVLPLAALKSNPNDALDRTAEVKANAEASRS